jgi:hypothetical protein
MAARFARWDSVLKNQDEWETTEVGFRELVALDRCHNLLMQRIGYETTSCGDMI